MTYVTRRISAARCTTLAALLLLRKQWNSGCHGCVYRWINDSIAQTFLLSGTMTKNAYHIKFCHDPLLQSETIANNLPPLPLLLGSANATPLWFAFDTDFSSSYRFQPQREKKEDSSPMINEFANPKGKRYPLER